MYIPPPPPFPQYGTLRTDATANIPACYCFFFLSVFSKACFCLIHDLNLSSSCYTNFWNVFFLYKLTHEVRNISQDVGIGLQYL